MTSRRLQLPENDMALPSPTNPAGSSLQRFTRPRTWLLALAMSSLWVGAAPALTIVVDYEYDTNNFFDTTVKRDALEAAADRYSRIITTSLNAVNLVDDNLDQRIGFTHPGNGASWNVSSAASAASDAIAGSDIADEYRGAWSIGEGEWILYAGGRSLVNAAGVGGTGTGLNFTSVLDSPTSVINRGFRDPEPTGPGDLPVWGGAITFDNDGDVNWHFDHTLAAPGGTTDFYSIALHEIGHALGLATSWDDWPDDAGGVYTGANAVAAYNADNGTSLTTLSEVGAANPHWAEDTYDSLIFASGDPNLTGTVGLGTPQDLLMEPSADFTGTVRRLELTNVDVAALRDVGWTVVPVPAALPLFVSAGLLLGAFRSRRQRG